MPVLAVGAFFGCSSAPERVALPVESAAPMKARESAPSIALEREVRYYVDEQGALWDDRGRKLDRASRHATPGKP